MSRSKWQLAIMLLLAGLSAYVAVVSYPYREWLLGATLTAVALSGVVLRVGWVVPCTIAGAYLGLLAIIHDPYMSYRTIELQVLIIAVLICIGTIVGCFIGLAIDELVKRRILKRSAVTTQPSEKPHNPQPHAVWELLSRERTETMGTAIERLREAEKAEQDAEYENGQNAGEKWVNDTATPSQLRRLDRYNDELASDHCDVFIGSPDAPYGHTDYLAFEIMGICKDEFDHDISSDFWEIATGQEITDDDKDFVFGFVDGALKQWHKLAAEL